LNKPFRLAVLLPLALWEYNPQPPIAAHEATALDRQVVVSKVEETSDGTLVMRFEVHRADHTRPFLGQFARAFLNGTGLPGLRR
jgi:hypothetical protein